MTRELGLLSSIRLVMPPAAAPMSSIRPGGRCASTVINCEGPLAEEGAAGTDRIHDSPRISRSVIARMISRAT